METTHRRLQLESMLRQYARLTGDIDPAQPAVSIQSSVVGDLPAAHRASAIEENGRTRIILHLVFAWKL
jgi:hypothetical protein